MAFLLRAKQIFLSALFLLLLAGATGLATPAHADACVIDPGRYFGAFGWTIQPNDEVSQDAAEMMSTKLVGTFYFDAACDGTLTNTRFVAVSTIAHDEHRLLTKLSAAECSGDATFTALSAKAVKSAKPGFPRLVLSVKGQYLTGNIGCAAAKPLYTNPDYTIEGGGGAALGIAKKLLMTISGSFTQTWTWQATEQQDPTRPNQTHARGFWFPGQFSTPANTEIQVGVDFVKAGPLPKATVTIEPTIIRAFLPHTGPIKADYKIHIDWGNGPKGTVSVTFDGKPVTDIDGAGDDYVAHVEIGDLDAGQHALIAIATGKGVQGQAEFDVPVVTIPPWGAAFHFTLDTAVTSPGAPAGVGACDGGDDHCAFYIGTDTLKWPDVSVAGHDPYITIPDVVPFIGGFWGLRPVTFKITARPTSSVKVVGLGKITGSGQVGLGSHNAVLNTQASEFSTDTTEAELQLHYSDAVLAAEPDPHFELTLGLSSVIPFETLHLVTAKHIIDAVLPPLVTLSLDAPVSGTAKIGEKPGDPSHLAVIGGSATLEMHGHVTAGGDLIIGKAQVHFDPTAKLVIELAPDTHVTDCSLSYDFWLHAEIVGYGGDYVPGGPSRHHDVHLPCNNHASLTPEDFSHRLTRFALSGATWRGLMAAGADALIAPAQAAEIPSIQLTITSRDGWVPESDATAIAPKPALKGRQQAAVASNVTSFVASPSVAAGPNGQIALAWIAEDPSKPRPRAWQTRLRLFDGKAWRPAITLGEGEADYTPQVSFGPDGRVYVAWVQMRPGKSGYGTVFDSALLDGMEIAAAIVDPAGGPSQYGVITHNAVADRNPQFARGSDGSLWFAWQTGTEGDKTAIRVVRWTGKGWSMPETLTPSGLVQNWQMAAGRNGAAAVVAVAGDKSRSVQLFSRVQDKWSGASLADNQGAQAHAVAAFGADNGVIVAWSDGSAVHGIVGGGAPARWLTSSSFPLALAMGGGSLVLTDGLHVTRADGANGAWSGPATVAAGLAGETLPGAAWTGRDWLIAGLSRTAAQNRSPASGNTQLAELVLNARR